MIATLLHTVSAVLLVIAVGITTKSSNAFRILTYLRVFSSTVVLGLLVVAGLAYLKIDSWVHGIRSRSRSRSRGRGGDADAESPPVRRRTDAGTQPGARRWLEIRAWAPWLELPTFAATAALAFLSVAIFVKPSQIRKDEQSLPYWVTPLAGWLALPLGALWWAGLR